MNPTLRRALLRVVSPVPAAAVALSGVAVAPVAVGLAAAPAAAFPGDAVTADLDGDGVADRVTPREGARSCVLAVEHGRPDGSFRAPVSRAYSLAGAPVHEECAQLLTVADLAGDGSPEVVLAWFRDSPWGGGDMLVLSGWQVSGRYPGTWQPQTIGTADFDGDGADDVWAVTDQGMGLETYLATPEAGLVQGPARLCSPNGTPSYALSDVDGDGATDLVGAHAECELEDGSVTSAAVVVSGRTGAQQVLREPTAGEAYLRTDVSDLDGDGDPDVTVVAYGYSPTGGADVVVRRYRYLNDGSGHMRAETAPALRARSDKAQVRQGKGRAVTVAVLANDTAPAGARVVVTSPPRYGTVTVRRDGSVRYTRTRGHARADSFRYAVVDGSARSQARVAVRVR